MRYFLRLVIYIGACFCTPVVIANNVTVITNNAHPIFNVPNGVRIINLDRAEELHEQLSANLPNNPEQAANIAKSRLSTAANDVQKALQDVVDAWSMGVVKVPAVIIDYRVVYGVSDIDRAIALINDFQELTP